MWTHNAPQNKKTSQKIHILKYNLKFNLLSLCETLACLVEKTTQI